MRILRFAITATIALITTFHAAAQEIKVAAAADLQFAMQEIVSRFQKDTGKVIAPIYGSSGNFFQQLQNGAPFDIFFSANLDYPRKLEAAGLAEPGSFYQYAKGKIVLWVTNDSKLDISQGLRSLLDPSVKKLAIANPQHAPYGQAAVAALKKQNLHDQLSAKFVMGENISQTSSFVVSGAADAGIIALSLALSPNLKAKGRYFEIPSTDAPPIEQACIILKSSTHKDVARDFVDYFKKPSTVEVLKGYGFDVPTGEKKP